MKNISPDLQAHLDSGTTTLCWCWKIVRGDGTTFGFTDHSNASPLDEKPATIACSWFR